MNLFDYVNNFFVDIRDFWRKYLYLICLPIGCIVFYILYCVLDIIDIDYSNIPGVCASFAGFLLTVYTILKTSLPDNSFTKRLKENRIYKTILNLIFISSLLQVATTILSILQISKELTMLLFITAMLETTIAFCYVFRAFEYSTRNSK